MKTFVAFLAILFMVTSAYAKCTIRMRVAESYPFFFQQKNGQWSGFMTEHGEVILKEAGCEIIYRKVPWGRALRLLEQGRLDMMGAMSVTEERKRFLYFIGPHFLETVKLLVSEDSEYEIETHDDLKYIPGKIGMLRGGWMGQKMNTLLKDASFSKAVHWVTSHRPEILEKIRMGRLGAYVRLEIPGLLNRPEYKGIKYHPFIINQDPVYFGLSKKSVNSTLLGKLQAALERVKKRGEFEKILRRYE